MTFTAGLDWGSDKHAVCVLDAAGRVVDRFPATHTAEGLAKLVIRLGTRCPATELRIAVERPSGLLIDTLVNAGFRVTPIHPNVVKACRPRYAAVNAKSDPGDAYLLADLLRTDGHRFRDLRPASDELKALRAMVRGRDDLVAERVALANQLRSVLESFWPGAACIFAAIDSPIGLAFIRQYPNPEAAAHLGPKRLATFLSQHGYSGRRSPEQLLQRLRAAPTGLANKLESESKRHVVLALVSVLEIIVLQIRELSSAIKHAIAQLDVGQIVMSFPRAGQINAAQIVAELGVDPARFGSDDAIAAEAGVCPVTYASGKRRGVGFRWACNKHLRKALTCFANNSRRSSPWAESVYRRARARGCDHPHAIRILARAWVRILWRCWVTATPYQPQLHTVAAALQAA